MGLGGALRLGGDFKFITWRGGGGGRGGRRQPMTGWEHFLWGELTRNEIHEMGKKWGRERFLYFMHYIFYAENFVG